MNDEAAESRGPSGPSQDAPAPSVPATPDSDTPTEALPTEAIKTEAAQTGATQAEATQGEATQAEATQAEATRVEPTAEMPTAETPTEMPTEMPAADVPPAWTPPAGGIPEADAPPADTPPADTPPTGAPSADAPPAGDATPPPPPPPGANNMPPWMTNLGGPGFSRDKLVRPRQGRYVAGVCAALARATNTDPVLWRVLLAVLGILSGAGVLLYLIGWLIIPAEGDTASPVESLLGKGRSGMAPLSVVVLGAAAVLSFAFIVHDGARAAVLAAAVILGAVLLIKRSGSSSSPEAATFPAAAGPGPVPPPAGPTSETARFTAPSFAAPQFTAPAASTATAEPVTAPLIPEPPATPGYSSAPPAEGYRPPFAPHGPWGPSGQQSYEPPRPPQQPPRPPKPPRERSKLGRLTFFAVVVVIGLMAVLDNAGAHIAISAYFAAALVTVALGLILGAWLGRARGLIFLAVLLSIGLGVTSSAERYGSQIGNSVYRPGTLAAVADRYDFTAGNATLDLRDVNFTGQQQTVTATMRFGQLKVLLPPNVDTTATVHLDNGRAVILGQELNDHNVDTTISDQGPDGAGGGTLKLDLQMDTGNLEVAR
ncbi:PspC domain-containing protein [Actinoplanes sp. NPDC051343]|uniref:PspC domain-containing protein n=1 Tax=Actinoplanes sp. NPDC051343 TaxID=3363906 RepID=UPI003790D613